MLIFDLETFPREDLSEQCVMNRVENLVLKSYDSRLKDPVKVAENIKKIDAENEQIKRNWNKNDSVDLDYAKIITIGYRTDDMKKANATTSTEEKKLIKGFFRFVENEAGPIVGFNSDNFDIPLLQRRCMMLNIPFSQTFQNTKRVDILRELMGYRKTGYKTLIEFAMAFGIPVNDQVADSSYIYEAWMNSDIDYIRDHCIQDVEITYQIYEMMRKANLIQGVDYVRPVSDGVGQQW